MRPPFSLFYPTPAVVLSSTAKPTHNVTVRHGHAEQERRHRPTAKPTANIYCVIIED
jgi:hypothetical protein